MDSRGPLHHRYFWVHHKANLWQVRVDGRQTADYCMDDRETRAMPGRLVEIMEHGPPALGLVERVPRINLHQPWSGPVNAGDLCQVHAGDVLDDPTRDSLRLR